jgi:hypothetical protein
MNMGPPNARSLAHVPRFAFAIESADTDVDAPWGRLQTTEMLMIRVRSLSLIVLAAAIASPAFADVTLKQTSVSSVMGKTMSTETVSYIKGTKMRVDDLTPGQSHSTIFDVEGRRMIVLNTQKREADIFDMAKIGADIAKLSVGEAKATITATPQTRNVAGSTCTVHNMEITVPMQMAGQAMEVVMSGPVCLVKNGPGQADFTAFYTAAATHGFVFGDPNAAKAQPGHARAMREMYREMASKGVPFATELTMNFKGSGPMAAMMSKMGGMKMTTELVSAVTTSIADSMFEIPAGFKINNR